MPWTRQQLEQEFHVEDRTVRKTLQAIGLDIKKDEYSDEEYERFKTARQMLDNGAKYREVQDYFNITNQSEDLDEQENSNGNILDELKQIIIDPVVQTMGDQADQALDTIIDENILGKVVLQKLTERRDKLKGSLVSYFQDLNKQGNTDENQNSNGANTKKLGEEGTVDVNAEQVQE